jgi:hypothetical protein
MGPNIIRKRVTGSIKAIDRDKRQIRGLASVQVTDRDGEAILIAGIHGNLTDPTRERVKFEADHAGEVIGTILSLTKTAVNGIPALEFVAQFLPAGVSPLADRVYQEIQAGARDTFSIGFLAEEWDTIPIAPGQTGRTFRKVELLEVSSVVLASNRGAVTLEKQFGNPDLNLSPATIRQLTHEVTKEAIRAVVDRIVERAVEKAKGRVLDPVFDIESIPSPRRALQRHLGRDPELVEIPGMTGPQVAQAVARSIAQAVGSAVAAGAAKAILRARGRVD